MSDTGSIKAQGVRVLLVDDYEINMEVAEGVLCQYGLSVDMASSGLEAIALCQEKQYPIIFMDQMMPEMDGIVTMEKIRQLNKYYAYGGEGKIVVLTADTENGVREGLLEKGFDDYLAKPIALKPLENILVKFLPEDCLVSCALTQELGQEEPLPYGSEEDRRTVERLLPEVDVSKGMLNCGGTLAGYLHVLQRMCRNGKSELEKLDTLYEEQQWEAYTIAVHALKGLALSVGAEPVAELAKQHEQAGKTGDYRFIGEHREQLQQEYGAFLGAVQEVLRQFDLVEEDKKDTLDKEDVLKLIKEVWQCMDDFDFAEAARLVREAEVLPMADGDRELLAQVSESVAEADIDRVEEILERCD